MTLHIQNYLRGHSDVEARLVELEATYGIFHERHSTYPNLVLFKYNQISSPMGEPIVQECRGLILDQNNDWSIVCLTFRKFFNLGEGHAAPINWATAKVYEKCDGSLCQVYWYADKWHVATSGKPDASGDVNNSGLLFRNYFWDTYNNQSEFRLKDENKHYCFAFELMGPLNRIVVVHPEPKLKLIGVRDMRTLKELSVEEAASLFYTPYPDQLKIPKAESFPIDSFEAAIASFDFMDPLKQEGYVVMDSDFNRVKVKHPGYVALHHAKDGLNTKAFVEIARKGEICEVITAFPEFEPMLRSAQEKVTAFCDQLQAEYDAIKHIPEQKPFALEANKTRCPSAMFSLRQGKIKVIEGNTKLEFPLSTAKDYASKIRIDTLMEYLGY